VVCLVYLLGHSGALLRSAPIHQSGARRHRFCFAPGCVGTWEIRGGLRTPILRDPEELKLRVHLGDYYSRSSLPFNFLKWELLSSVVEFLLDLSNNGAMISLLFTRRFNPWSAWALGSSGGRRIPAEFCGLPLIG